MKMDSEWRQTLVFSHKHTNKVFITVFHMIKTLSTDMADT